MSFFLLSSILREKELSAIHARNGQPPCRGCFRLEEFGCDEELIEHMDLRLTHEGFKLERREGAYSAPAGELSRLFGQRGGRICFQALLTTEEKCAWNLGAEPWFSQRGGEPVYRLELLSPFPAALWHEKLHLDDDGAYRADALLPHPVRELAAGETAAAFIELTVPEDAPAGKAELELRLYETRLTDAETLRWSCRLPLTVYAVPQLPAEKRPFCLDLWQHHSNIARKHGVPLWSEGHFACIRRYARALAALGQSSVTVVLSDGPWRGQSCIQNDRNPSNLFEYSMARIIKGRDGQLRFDFSAMDRVIEIFDEEGVRGDIEVFGLVNIWPNAAFDGRSLIEGFEEPQLSLRVRDEKSGAYDYIHTREEAESYLRAVEAHFVERGWEKRVRVSADEPADPERFRRTLALLGRLMPRLKLRTAINHAEFIEAFESQIDDFIPNLESTLREYERLKDYQARMPDKRFLWYVCCGPDHPNTFLRSDLTQARLVGPLTYFLGFDGFLRWNFTVWPDDPLSDIRYGPFPAGDTNFVYPGPDGGPLLTLRYKALQRGLEDYALLRAVGGERAREALKMILRGSAPSDFLTEEGRLKEMDKIASGDYGDFEALRETLLKALDERKA